MSLKFFNIRSKEILVADSEPKIAALWSSSDRSPNAQQGQDFGWRLAPEVVVKLRRIKKNEEMLITISNLFKKPLDELKEYDILTYISMKTQSEDAPVAQDEDYEDEYNMEIRKLERLSEQEPSAPKEDEEDLNLLQRFQLNEMAEDLGISDPGDMPNKPAVIAAIKKVRLELGE